MGILISSKAAEGIKYTIDELEIRANDAIIEAIKTVDEFGIRANDITRGSNTEIKTGFSSLAVVAKQFAEDRVTAVGDTTTLNRVKLKLDRAIAAMKFLLPDDQVETLASYSLHIYSCAMEGYALNARSQNTMATYEAIAVNDDSQQEKINSIIEGKENALDKRRSLCL